jgi:hypothetical protein
MSNYYRVFKDIDGEVSEPKKINFEHELGDIVNRHSYDTQYKCTEIISKDGVTTYIFKQGKKIYTFDW